MDCVVIISLIFSGIAALAAFSAIIYSVFERRSNIRKEFVLWALKRLSNEELRQARSIVYKSTKKQIQSFVKKIKSNNQDIDIEKIRQVGLSFDEIGSTMSSSLNTTLKTQRSDGLS